MGIRIRPAGRENAPLVLGFIRDLAAFEQLSHEVRATEELIAAALSGPNPRTFCEIAEFDGEPCGFALWFYSFSTFHGRGGIYLEDLFVRPEQRGRGVGRAFLEHLARRCRAENLPRLEWSVLDWNEPALRFYRSLGAEPRTGWTTFRLAGEPLARLAGTSS